MKILFFVLLANTFNSDFIFSQQWKLINNTAGVRISWIDIYISNPDTIVAIGDGVWLSTDNGNIWSQISTKDGSGCIKVDGKNSKYFYASVFTPASGDGIDKSTDGGKTWQKVVWSSGPFRTFVEINPSDKKTVYVGYGPYYLWRSNNRGETWDTVQIPQIDFPVLDAKIFPANDSIIYLSYMNSIFKSTNKGASWFPTSNTTGAHTLAIHPSYSNIVYAMVQNGTGVEPKGVYKTTDGGGTWNQMNTGLNNLQIHDWSLKGLILNAKKPEELFLFGGSNPQIILYRSSNGGETWELDNNGFPEGGHISSIAIDTLNNKIFAGTSFGIYTRDLVVSAKNEDHQLSIHQYLLQQNYPNPFNGQTVIKFQLPQKEQCLLEVYNLLGEKISVLFNEVANAGVYELKFDAKQFSSGIFFYKIQAGKNTAVKKMLLLK